MRDVTIQHIVHRDRHRPLDPGRHGNLRDVTLCTEDALTCTNTPPQPATSAASGGAFLDG
jgi:hypothetical protein